MRSTAPGEKDVLSGVRTIATDMARGRPERQRRRHLDRADFDRLSSAGFLRTGIPEEQGGLWRGVSGSVRHYCDLVYAISRGDPSVGLVASMHPTVLVYGMVNDTAPKAFADSWTRQRDWCFQTAQDGHWWGTITSEPGSGGDIMKTMAVVEPNGGGGLQLTGDKHFGSGSGITSYMITTAKLQAKQCRPRVLSV